MSHLNLPIHHRRSIRLQGYDYSQAGAYFVTICAWQRGCLFGEVVAGKMRLNAVGKIVEWEWRRLGEGFPNIELGEFVVMPNHIHGIIFIHAAERATRYEQNLSINGNVGLPDEASAGIVGSPLRGPGGPPSQSLGAIIGQWKSHVTKRAWKLPGMRGMPVWQRNYYEHIIRDEADYQRIAQYIQTNPLRSEQDQLHPQAPPNQFNQDRTHGD